MFFIIIKVCFVNNVGDGLVRLELLKFLDLLVFGVLSVILNLLVVIGLLLFGICVNIELVNCVIFVCEIIVGFILLIGLYGWNIFFVLLLEMLRFLFFCGGL